MRTILPRPFRLGLAGLLLALFAPSQPMAADTPPDPTELQELNAASFDSTESKRVIARARALLAQNPDPGYQMFLRQIMLRSHVRGNLPVRAILAAADSLKPLIGEDPRVLIQFNALMSRTMLDRGAAEHAHRFAEQALQATPRDAAWTPMRAEVLTLLGMTETERGRPAEAIAHLTTALPAAGDTHTVLLALGKAYERGGKPENAIDSYLRAIGTFPCRDTTARSALGALFAKHRPTDDLNASIEARCNDSRRVVALDSRRYEVPARDWSLTDFDGKPVRFADHKGKVVVLDFWGSWCGPCRTELPYFQAMYERFRDKGVSFIGISWERVQTREEAVRASRTFMEQNGLNFPSAVDHDRVAVDGYDVESFPTVFVIDKTGKVRYRNIGFNPAIDDIMAAQIESLLE